MLSFPAFGWLKAARRFGPAAKTGRPVKGPRAPRFRPCLENLEDRLVPSTLVVTNNLDHGTGSLRAAIAAGPQW